MKLHLKNLSLVILLFLGVQLRAGAQPAPPPVELQPVPAQAAPQMPVSPETPGVAGANSYYGSTDAGSYEDDGYSSGPAGRGFFGGRTAGGNLASALPGMWAEFDALVWWNKGRHLPALVTTSPTGTAQADAAIIGTPGTTALFGSDQIGNHSRGGGRVNFGVWLDPEENIGIGNRMTSVAGDDVSYNNQSDGTLILGRPFFNVPNDQRDASLIGFPGQFAGDVHANSSSSFFMNDFYGKFRMSDNPVNRVDLLLGYQYARIGDDLWISSSTTNINPSDTAFGVRFDYYDQFRVTNKYDGVVGGLSGDYVKGRAKFSWLGKLGYGNMNEVLKISGVGTASNGSGSVPLNGGFLAQPSNIGTYHYNRHVFVPEVNFNLHLQVTQRLDFSIGYSFVYFTNVLLAGDQVDRRLNLTQQVGPLTGQAFPLPQSNNTDFWLQGLNFGLNGTF